MKLKSVYLFLLTTVICCRTLTVSAQSLQSTPAVAFALPEIPSEMKTTQARADYLVTHYWSHFDFADSSLIAKPEITEQAFVDFIDLLPRVSYNTATQGINTMLEAAAKGADAMLPHFAELCEKYLYDQNSPFRNEEYYIPVLQHIVASPKLGKTDKIRPQYQLSLALRNRVGAVATDFEYTMRNGTDDKMSNLRARYVVLFFNNPDCSDCKRVKQYMTNSPVINLLLGDNDLSSDKRELAIFSIYPDADLPLWLQTQYPKKWINGYDAGQVINHRQLYDLSAMPTLYLLDSAKRVILKDTTVEIIEAWLREHVARVE